MDYNNNNDNESINRIKDIDGGSQHFDNNVEYRQSQVRIYSSKTSAQSLDFEETESVMWRKVSYIQLSI